MVKILIDLNEKTMREIQIAKIMLKIDNKSNIIEKVLEHYPWRALYEKPVKK